ncbi:MAG: threonine--tRNA ligase [Phycisphaeraceae bacterium]|nr:MAG: threonine--tRNA ligase [Phycisphaeraceae bacterium]
MPKITLPDGSVKEFDGPVTAYQVAESIGSRLAKAAVGAKVDGVLSDLSTTLDSDCELAIVTEKTREGDPDPDALFLLRHSAAHVMAEAIQRVVPGALLVYGPPLETGFYYDIAFPEDRPLREGDFEAIEKEMEAIVKDDRAFTRYEMPVADGMSKLDGEGSKYKIDNARRAVDAGSDALSWYATGEPGKDWEDLCRGPHVPSTGRIGAFKIMSLASAYWHGDENSDRLTRVYGTAFFSKKDLDHYLHQLEEAKKRDHRVLGKQLDLFHIDDEVGQGLVLWTPRGSIVRKELQDWIGGELRKMGYTDVFCPHIGKLGLYKTSGHFPYYQDSQFTPVMEKEFLAAVSEEGCSCADLSNRMRGGEIDGYLLKPMNCPHHIKIYASRPRSYRDLPIRLSEFGTVYRWEQSGELNGLTRVRSFTVDDAHLFCREDQVADEVSGCLSLVKIALDTLGLEDFRVRVGLRDPDSSKYVGDPEVWDKAEQACRDAAAQLGSKVTEEPGEAAFYGPKIDFVVKDVIGREWQLGTVQVDYNLPKRFDLEYIGSDNKPHRPVMIHRAPFGSMERFVGVLIEHFAGAFPLWLAPEQVRVLPVSEKSNDYAETVCARLKDRGVRVSVDTHNDRVQAKIKHAASMKIPYSAIVGPRDEAAGQVSVRAFGINDALGSIPVDEFVEGLVAEIACKGAERLVDRFEAATA